MPKGIGEYHHGYQAAEQGESPTPPEYLLESTSDVDNREAIVNRAADRLIEQKFSNFRGKNQYTDTGKSAWDITLEAADTDQEHIDLLRLVTYEAVSRTEYWGVEDPDEERYCTGCQSVKSMVYFGGGDFRTCDSCRQKWANE